MRNAQQTSLYKLKFVFVVVFRLHIVILTHINVDKTRVKLIKFLSKINQENEHIYI